MMIKFQKLWTTKWNIFIAPYEGVLRSAVNIYDRKLCNDSLRHLCVNFCWKTLPLRCLQLFWLHLKVFLKISQNSQENTCVRFCFFFNKVVGQYFMKKRLSYSCFPVNNEKYFRTPFLQNTLRRLLLRIIWLKPEPRCKPKFKFGLSTSKKIVSYVSMKAL